MPKGALIRALMGMKHSPAGKKYLADKQYAAAEKKAGKKKKGAYSGMRTRGIDAKLRRAGLSESEINSLRGSKSE